MFPALLGQPDSNKHPVRSKTSSVQGLNMKHLESDVGLGQGMR